MMRKYPVGIQSFEKIRSEGYIYIDKTPLIYKMITEGCPYFLSRPRRFGKSLLVSTLAAVFEGRRELFESFTTQDGIEQPQLYIATTNWKWEKYPVFHFDFSSGDLRDIEQLDEMIDETLSSYEQMYGIPRKEKRGVNIRMIELLRTSHAQTGKRAVVLVDEYDNFILHALGNAEKVDQARHRFQNLFGPLKAEDDHLQFVFITGISKYSSMSIFSGFDNLNDISMRSDYDTLCGISKEELTAEMKTDIELMAERNQITCEGMRAKLQALYGGYHFGETLTEIYNPFNLFNAFNTGNLSDFWLNQDNLSQILSHIPTIDIMGIERNAYLCSWFDLPILNYDNPLPVLIQYGYLTIKSCQNDDNKNLIYRLGIPNEEVRCGLAQYGVRVA